MSEIRELLQEIVKRSQERKLTTRYWNAHGQPREPFPCMVASPAPSVAEVREMEEALDEMTRRFPRLTRQQAAVIMTMPEDEFRRLSAKRNGNGAAARQA